MFSDLQNVFCLIILRGHFKDETYIIKINQLNEQVPFKIKNKEKRARKEICHTKRKELIIAEADKGGSVVIMDTQLHQKN